MRPTPPTPAPAEPARLAVPLALSLALSLASCLAACDRPPPAPAHPVPVVASAAAPVPEAPAREPAAPTSNPAAAPVQAPSGGASLSPGPPVHRLVARIPWGEGARALGRSRGAESNPEAPMAIAGDAAGRLWILDQVRDRVVQLDGGALGRSLKVPLRVPQDIALAGGQLLVLDRLADRALVALDLASGAERWRMPVADGAGVTGVFVHAGGVWLEREHSAVRRLGALDGAVDAMGRALPGRPSRLGDLGLAAHRAGPGKVVLTGHTLDVPDPAALPPAWSAEVTFARPAVQILALDSDPWGRVWLAVNSARERPDGTLGDERLEVLRFGRGAPKPWRGPATLEVGPEEQHRTFAVGAEGSLWHLARREDSAVIERWTP